MSLIIIHYNECYTSGKRKRLWKCREQKILHFFSLPQGKGLATKYPREVFLKMLIGVLQEEKQGHFSQEGNIIKGREG